MSQSARRDANRLALKVITAIVLGFAIIENGWFFVELALWIPWLTMVYIVTIAGASCFLFLWLRFRFREDTWAVLGTAVAAAAWPWTLFLSFALPSPKFLDAAWLFGPLIPYALLAAVGLCKRR
jgi:hypothetical protein